MYICVYSLGYDDHLTTNTPKTSATLAALGFALGVLLKKKTTT